MAVPTNAKPAYVLVTPARNEEDHIGRTLESVVSQTVPPRRYVVVSDGSTDKTDQIVRDYAARHDFIFLVRREPDSSRNFGSKAYAIAAGLERLEGVEYEFIGNLDADLSFQPDYFEILLSRIQADPALGVAGGLIHDLLDAKWTPLFMEPEWSVSGAVQMFRRACFEKIGGYLPLRRGGIDAAAEIMTRMNGWRVRTYPDLAVCHYRRGGGSKGGILSARFRQGIHEFSLNYHPVFEMARCIARIRQKPYLVGSLWRMAGYCQAALKREPRVLPRDVARYLRQEQMRRLWDKVLRRTRKGQG